ncbi:MAG: hypothetical protein Q7T33_03225 [Dehalococcoidia bacterium]|nr:hypothetical protein [Dehalococcoidia bacterium]
MRSTLLILAGLLLVALSPACGDGGDPALPDQVLVGSFEGHDPAKSYVAVALRLPRDSDVDRTVEIVDRQTGDIRLVLERSPVSGLLLCPNVPDSPGWSVYMARGQAAEPGLLTPAQSELHLLTDGGTVTLTIPDEQCFSIE